MNTKKCEICGKVLPIEEFSKSYRNRCRKCVADLSREARKAINHNDTIVIDTVDWEARRYDLTKSILLVLLDKDGYNRMPQKYASNAVLLADEVILKLKEVRNESDRI